MPTEQEVLQAAGSVLDPDIGISIVDLGLVYGASIQEGTVEVRMTLTSPWCPAAPMLMSQVHDAVATLAGVEEVKVELVWDPPWDPGTMASEEVKSMLGIF